MNKNQITTTILHIRNSYRSNDFCNLNKSIYFSELHLTERAVYAFVTNK